MIIRGPHVLPLTGCDLPGRYRGREHRFPRPADEANEQRARRDHPDVDAPAVRFVVEDRAGAARVVDPRQQRERALRVQSASVRELDVAVPTAEELVRAVGGFVGPRSRPHAHHAASGVAKQTDVTRSGAPVQWIDCRSSRGTWE